MVAAAPIIRERQRKKYRSVSLHADGLKLSAKNENDK